MEAYYLLQLALRLFSIAGGGGSSSGSSSSGGGGYSGGSSYDSSSSSGSGDSDPRLALFIIAIMVIAFIISYVADKKTAKKKAQGSSDVGIDQTSPLAVKGAELFTRFQTDWSNFNLTSMKRYLSERYFQHIQLMMAALKLADRTNIVENVNVTYAKSTSPNVVTLAAAVRDRLVVTSTGEELYSRDYPHYQEHYRFVGEGANQKLDGINTASAAPSQRRPDLEAFAAKSGFFYSLDWGSLLLPRRGQLFSGGNFLRSDINNHVIGDYKGLVVQLYTYVPEPDGSRGGDHTNYLIAQVNVPKDYGNIIVRHQKQPLGDVRGLTKMQTEWGNFNDTYHVYASDLERATSFELLTPTYMEQLEAAPFIINIEVVDNVIYLYSADATANYPMMLTLLKSAFNELKM